MDVYVVSVFSYKDFSTKVSQEGYKTLKAAQDYCKSTGAEKLNDWVWRGGELLYTINVVTVK